MTTTSGKAIGGIITAAVRGPQSAVRFGAIPWSVVRTSEVADPGFRLPLKPARAREPRTADCEVIE
jgi:hypothetical protein